MKKLFRGILMVWLLVIPQILQSVDTPFGINCGSGSEYVDSQNFTWSAQTGYLTGGLSQYVDVLVVGTTEQDLYKWENYAFGAITYAIPLTNGTYTVRLGFAEFFEPRTDEVYIEGVFQEQVVLPYDYTVYQRDYTVAVSDGTLDISIQAVSGIPILNSIFIPAPPATPTVTPTFTPVYTPTVTPTVTPTPLSVKVVRPMIWFRR